MSLDLKYRPDNFDDVIGNEPEIKSLISALDKENGDHSFVIMGPAGCCKTTLARIAAKHLEADDLSISEFNTGTNRGIDTSRAIIEQMKFSMGGVRVFIIDECHGMTPDAKRALLKPTEEPPKHVYFFFLTTDPVKFFKGDEGKAMKTRLFPVKVAKLKPTPIYKHIRKICKKEDLDIDGDTLQYIAKNCEGSPRRALKFVDAIRDLEDDEAMMEKLESMTLAEDPEVFEFCRHLFNRKPSWNTLAQFLLAFKDKQDPEGIRRMIMGYAQSVMLKAKKMDDFSRFAANTLECFCDCDYSSGMPGLTLATWQALEFFNEG